MKAKKVTSLSLLPASNELRVESYAPSRRQKSRTNADSLSFTSLFLVFGLASFFVPEGYAVLSAVLFAVLFYTLTTRLRDREYFEGVSAKSDFRIKVHATLSLISVSALAVVAFVLALTH